MILLSVDVWHWTLRAIDRLHFGHAGNTLRGALGYALAGTPEYARWFRPESAPGSGPSGQADPPRPFVLRAVHLDGTVLEPGSTFHFDIHSFETREDRFELIRQALACAGAAGLGPGRARAQLLPSAPSDRIAVPFHPPSVPVTNLRVKYLTPTELKGGTLSDFGALFARVRDRVSSLRALYGEGPLDIDFRAIGDRARAVRTAGASLLQHESQRTSSRTGQTHTLGGETGEVDFEGDLTEFVPWLEAAQWTGVGRQTVWGKGAVAVECGGRPAPHD
jgi:hypothetical protein